MATSKFVVLVTTNKHKLREYEEVFSKYGIIVVPIDMDPATLDMAGTFFEVNPTCIAVLHDTNNVHDPRTHEIVDVQTYRGRVNNVCALTAITRDTPTQTFLGLVEGNISGPLTIWKDAFGWDGHFTPAHLTLNLYELDKEGSKVSARQQALSSFVSAHLNYKGEKVLRWFHLFGPQDKIVLLDPKDSVESFLAENRYTSKLSWILGDLKDRAVHEGVFFRHNTSKRVGNYWLPGLNGGIPFTAKKDPIHEITFLFHDLMHNLTPDLVFDGSTSPLDARLYMTWRLMSEAYSLVFADMVFVNELAKDPSIEYDWSKRAIYPLYVEMVRRGDTLPMILRNVVTYIVTGDPSQLPEGSARDAFVTKYEPFFAQDWRWTLANWEALKERKRYAKSWVESVGGSETFRSVGLFTISDAKAILEVKGEDTIKEISSKISTFWNRRLLLNKSTVKGHPLGNAHRRYLLGQIAVYARYDGIVRTKAGFDTILEVIKKEEPTPEDTKMARKVLHTYLTMLQDFNAIATKDAIMYNEVFPHFDPFFVNYDDGSSPKLTDILERIREKTT